jgi:hypothetical protein
MTGRTMGRHLCVTRVPVVGLDDTGAPGVDLLKKPAQPSGSAWRAAHPPARPQAYAMMRSSCLTLATAAFHKGQWTHGLDPG